MVKQDIEDELNQAILRIPQTKNRLGDIESHFAKKFHQAGYSDRAWELFNQAVRHAIAEGYPTDHIRRDMANQLNDENHNDTAVQIMFSAIVEAHHIQGEVRDWVIYELKDKLRKAGFNMRLKQFRGMGDKLAKLCIDEGFASAKDYYSELCQLRDENISNS